MLLVIRSIGMYLITGMNTVIFILINLKQSKKCQIFQAGNESIGMVEYYTSNFDDVDQVQDFLLKQDLLAIIPDKLN